MSVSYVEKDRSVKANYTFDWATELGTDTIPVIGTPVVWRLPPSLTQEAISNTTTTTTIRLSGGTVGKLHRIRCEVTTDSQILKRTLYVRISRK